MIKIINISKEYDKNVLFSNVNHQFSNGINRISGKNGTGKTSLLNIIAGHDDDFTGEIQNRLMENTSYMPDVLNTFNTIRVNTFVKSILKELNVSFDEQLSFLKNIININPFLNLKLQQLSFGQKRKLILFLSLIQQKRVWLLDEPFAGLDAESINSVVDFLKKQQDERIIIMTTHGDNIPFDFKSELPL